MAKDQKALAQTLKKIPIFSGLSPSQIHSVLDVCTSVQGQTYEVIYTSNSSSDRMHILVTGELAVINDEGIRLARLYPITTVGEMGLVTRHTRSASVEVVKPSRLLVIQKVNFDALLRHDTDLQTKFYQNVIGILCGKIVGDNVRVREHLMEKVEHQRQLKLERRRTDTMLQILVEHTSIQEEEARSMVDERLIPDRMRILIVDDEPCVCELVAAALADYDIDQAYDGTEALKVVETNPPDLVVTDIRMPNMDGTSLLKAIRSIAPNLPIIGLSGYVEAEDVAEFGFDGFVRKPFKFDEFRSIVDQTVSTSDEATA